MEIICTKCQQKNPPNNKFCSNCGQDLPLQTGTSLRDGKYLIETMLSKGSFGRIYLAEDTGRFDEKVVIKELSPIFQNPADLQKAEQLFKREAKTMSELDHKQIPKFREQFQYNQKFFLVQDFIKGKTYKSLLIEKLSQNPPQYFTEPEILELINKLLPVLDYIHSKNIIHRDIAPDNIVLREADKMPVLIDFGGVKELAIQANQIANSNMDNEGTCLYKAGYSPPEQIMKNTATPSSDLYALATTALCLGTGEWQPTSTLQDYHTGAWIWQQKLKLSSQLTQALNKMLEADATKRFQSVSELQNFLAQEEPQIAKPPPTLSQLFYDSLTTGSAGWLITLGIFSLVQTVLGSGLIMLVLGGLILGILAIIRPSSDVFYLSIVALIIMGLQWFLWVNLLIFQLPWFPQRMIALGILIIIAVVLAFVLMQLSQIINSFSSKN